MTDKDENSENSPQTDGNPTGERQKTFSRRALLEAGWSVPLIAAVHFPTDAFAVSVPAHSDAMNPHADANPHNDDGTHSDSAHSDVPSHFDADEHVDSPEELVHVDGPTHADVFHTDTGHTDEAIPHVDFPHQDGSQHLDAGGHNDTGSSHNDVGGVSQ